MQGLNMKKQIKKIIPFLQERCSQIKTLAANLCVYLKKNLPVLWKKFLILLNPLIDFLARHTEKIRQHTIKTLKRHRRRMKLRRHLRFARPGFLRNTWFLATMWIAVLCGILFAVAVLVTDADFFAIESWIFSDFYIIFALFPVIHVFFLIALFFFYKPPKRPIPLKKTPGCTVIMPAYNEGHHVVETLQSILNADYPAEQLEIIAVNDGSKDDTLAWINSVANHCDGRIKVIDLPVNSGKKHALAAGIRTAKFDYIITVDSDSIIYPDAITKLIDAFADPRIGAVAGNLRAKNDFKNFYTLIMDVLLVLNCEFMRSAQSVTGTVFCTPGALSAYRKRILLPRLDEWLNQTFMGGPAKIGEDRAIATLILRSGYYIVNQREAIAETNLPENYDSLCKMLLRWTRSDFRENIVMTVFVLDGLKELSLRSVFLFLHWLLLGVNLLLPVFFLPVSIITLIVAPHFLPSLSYFFLSCVLWNLIPCVFYGKARSFPMMIWCCIFGLFTSLALSWISFYALFTIHNSNWLTRTGTVKKTA